MVKRFAIMLVGFILVVGALGYYKYTQIMAGMAKGASFVPPPDAVTTARAAEETWQNTINSVGTFAPVQGVTVGAEESGKVVAIAFESGQPVKKGDLLVQLDVSVEKAQLAVSEAKAELAKTNLERYQKLAGSGAIAQSDMDNVQSQLKQAQAEADSLQATIDRRTIRAPFSGRTGIRQVQLGQYLSAGNPVVTLQTLDPIYLNFSLPQQELSRIHAGQVVNVEVDSFPAEVFEGKISAINSELDASTRNVDVQATLANAGEKLRSGMFAKVSVQLEESQKVITLPSTAINRAPYFDSVYVIEQMKDPQGKSYLGARQQLVKLGPTRGDQIAVLSGVKAGEEVATSGLFKLRPGGAVKINNDVMPENKVQPKPRDS